MGKLMPSLWRTNNHPTFWKTTSLQMFHGSDSAGGAGTTRCLWTEKSGCWDEGSGSNSVDLKCKITREVRMKWLKKKKGKQNWGGQIVHIDFYGFFEDFLQWQTTSEWHLGIYFSIPLPWELVSSSCFHLGMLDPFSLATLSQRLSLLFFRGGEGGLGSVTESGLTLVGIKGFIWSMW